MSLFSDLLYILQNGPRIVNAVCFCSFSIHYTLFVALLPFASAILSLPLLFRDFGCLFHKYRFTFGNAALSAEPASFPRNSFTIPTSYLGPTLTGTGEVPFSVDLVLEETGEVLPCKLSGIFDLVESDEEGTLIIVELKTSSKRYTDDQIDLDLQGTLYSYALKQIRLHTNGDDTLVRYDQLLKQKTPSMETYYAVKGNVQYTWAYHLVRKVLRAIDHEVYHPIPGWQCKDCPYGTTCQENQE